MTQRLVVVAVWAVLLPLGLSIGPGHAATTRYLTTSGTTTAANTTCALHPEYSHVRFLDRGTPVQLDAPPADQFGTTPFVVVQTGRLPVHGPGLPVSPLTQFTGDIQPGRHDQHGFRLRALDQHGRATTTNGADRCHNVQYHASIPLGRVRGITLVAFAHL
jgi:hypothetical protein